MSTSPSEQRHDSLKLLMLQLYFASTIYLQLVSSIGAILFNVDSTHKMIPGPSSDPYKFYYTFFRGVILVTRIFLGWHLVVFSVIYMIIIVPVMQLRISQLVLWSCPLTSVTIDGNVSITHARDYFSITRAFRIHNQLALIVNVVNDTYQYFLPVLLLSGIILLVGCNVMCIRLLEELVFPITMILPLFSMTCLITIHVLFPGASQINSSSVKYLAQCKDLVGTNKIFRRILAAQREIRLKFGFLFYAKSSTEATYFMSIGDWTVNALLA